MLLTFSLVTISPVKAIIQAHMPWSFHENGIDLKLTSPIQSYAGQNITVTANLTAYEEIQNLTLQLQLIGPQNEGNGTWNYSHYIYQEQDFANATAVTNTTDILIPSDVSPGSIFCVGACNWTAYHELVWQNFSKTAYFLIVYLKNAEYENYVATHSHNNTEYNNLNTTYYNYRKTHSHNDTEYNNLQKAYNDYKAAYSHTNTEYNNLLGNYTRYIASHIYSNIDYDTARLVTAIVAFIGTTVVLFVKRKRPIPTETET